MATTHRTASAPNLSAAVRVITRLTFRPLFAHARPGGVQTPPAPKTPPGALVYLHGGGYVAGSVRAGRAVAEALAAHTGLPVLVPEYRRAPEHRFPAALNDCLGVLRHLDACGVPASRIAIAGDSAGAHLAVGLTAARISGGAAGGRRPLR